MRVYRMTGLILGLGCLILGSCTSQQIGETAFDNVEPFTNSLAGLPSPYYAMHAHQAIDWLPWDTELMSLAQKENKPILLQTGFASSFEAYELTQTHLRDTILAQEINQQFIPAIADADIYPAFIRYARADFPFQESATLVLSPDGEVLDLILPGQNWAEDIRDIDLSPREISPYSSTQGTSSIRPWRTSDLSLIHQKTRQALWERHRTRQLRNGSFPGAALLLQMQAPAPPYSREAKLVPNSLKALCTSPLYDHIGGGFFARMSVGEKGKANFAKHLPDQIVAIHSLAKTYARYPSQELDLYLQQCLDFVEKVLAHEDGGYISGISAESQGEKGRYYLWSDIDIAHVLKDQAQYAERYLGITHEGNWDSALNLPTPMLPKKALAAGFRLPEIEMDGILDQIREKLETERSRRAAPKPDQKRLVSHNAQLALVLFEMGYLLDDPLLQERGLELLRWTYFRNRDQDGYLHRYYYEGLACEKGQLADYAYLSQACFAGYMQSMDVNWLDRGLALLEMAIPLFYDAASGRFKDEEIGQGWSYFSIHSHMQQQAQAMMANSLWLASRLRELPTYRDLAARQFEAARNTILEDPASHALWAIQVQQWAAPRPLIQVDPEQQPALVAFWRQQNLPFPCLIGTGEPLPNGPFNGPVWQAGNADMEGNFPELVPLIQSFDW